MVKSYLTFASSETLAGYENGGADWLKDFNARVRVQLEHQKQVLDQTPSTGF